MFAHSQFQLDGWHPVQCHQCTDEYADLQLIMGWIDDTGFVGLPYFVQLEEVFVFLKAAFQLPCHVDGIHVKFFELVGTD